MIFKDYYRILGLKTNKVNLNEIKSAYREMAKKFHPDLNVENEYAEERFKDINEAYKVLTNSNDKRKYDRMWNSNIASKRKQEKFEESSRSDGSIFSDFFHMFFGDVSSEEKNENVITQKRKKVPIKGENIETAIDISIEDGFFGTEKKISLRATNGKMKTFAVKIPAGIRNNEKIRLIGQGKSGSNGGNNGDLFIKINIKDGDKLKLRCCDIYTDLLLTPCEAALGTRVNISGIDDGVKIYVPQGIGSGEKVRIPGKGYKDGKGSRGDLIAEIKIVVPKQLTEMEKEVYEKLNEISKFNPRNN